MTIDDPVSRDRGRKRSKRFNEYQTKVSTCENPSFLFKHCRYFSFFIINIQNSIIFFIYQIDVFSVVFVRYEVFGLFVAWTVWSIRSVKSLTLSRKFRKQNPDSGNLWERVFRKQNPDSNSRLLL